MALGRQIKTGGDLRQCWTTPPELFNQLHNIFNFTVDACANEGNALLSRYWSLEQDCRDQSWDRERVFCNPPFGFIGSIVPKAEEAEVAVFLLPLTTMTTRYMGKYPPKLYCIPDHRIVFTPPEGLDSKCHPSLGTVIAVYGMIDQSSTTELGKIGQIYSR